MTFHTAIQNMMNGASDDVVGLVMRWDYDENRMWTFFSTPRAVLMPANLAPVALTMFTKSVWDEDNNHYFSVANTARAGLHAEEIMLAAWEGLIQISGPPTKCVDLILSKSPCHGDSGSSPMVVNYNAAATNFNVFGCSSKLAMFISASTVPKWRIGYYELAGSKSDSTDMQRHLAGAQYQGGLDALRAAGDVKKANWQAHVPEKVKKAPLPIQQQEVNKAVQNSEKKYIDNEQNKILRNQMRHVSVMQAQAGLVKLEAIAKVDIFRILDNPVNNKLN